MSGHLPAAGGRGLGTKKATRRRLSELRAITKSQAGREILTVLWLDICLPLNYGLVQKIVDLTTDM
jgi:hypothetical protein